MQKIEKKPTCSNSTIAFVDYKPAELKLTKDWLIVYYAKNPITSKFERFRVRVPKLKKQTERKEYAKKIVFELNEKLKGGWLPYYESKNILEFKTISFCVNTYIEQLEKDFIANNKRFDTLRSYKNTVKKFMAYFLENEPKVKLIMELKKDAIIRYLDYMLYVKENRTTTYNNNLILLNIFFKWCVERGFLKSNPTEGISKRKKQPKIRKILSTDAKLKLKAYGTENSSFYTLCMLTYYCYIRTTELTKIKVKDVSLVDGYVKLHSANTKNKKDEIVTIPNNMYDLLIEHLQKATNEDFLFSNDNFNTGKIQLKLRKITNKWNDFRKKNNIESIYQFYSLKDTGITDLLNSGVPALKVRNQARHYDLKITETYTHRNETCDETIKNANFNF